MKNFILSPNQVREELGKEEINEELVSNCCGAKTTEPDADGLAICLDCKEGCVVEKEDLLEEKLNQEYQENMADDLKDIN